MRLRELPEEPGPGRRLSTRLTLRLVTEPGVTVPLAVRLSYRTADPLVLRLTFDLRGEAPVSWEVSRDLLVAGLSTPAGLGDLHVRPYPPDPDQVELQLRPPGTCARLLLPLAELRQLLSRTDRMVPFGDEFSEAELDRELAQLFQSS